MARWIALMLLGVLFAVAPYAAAEQARPEARTQDLLLRVNGLARVGPGERVTTVVVVGNDALVEGTVERALIVAGGSAEVNGAVDGNVIVADGRLTLGPAARVGGDVTLVRSELVQSPGATISGAIHRSSALTWSWGAAWLFWLSTSVLVIAAGLVFAAIGGRQLSDAARVLLAKPLSAILVSVILWIVLPVLAVAAFFTVLGIPLGFTVLLLVLPALWFLGYLVAGTSVGAALVRRRQAIIGAADHPYAAAALGLLLLQLVGFIPWIGGAIVGVAGFIGAGALVLRSWRVLRGQSGAPGAAVPA